ncbi:MAG: acyl-CoA thioesterase [Pseudomonadaceae bacterium]|nr:acyl-CoA thioesterase [Pseudomonadaceae bacterium]
MQWDLAQPFTTRFTVTAEAIDHYKHVNNAEYLRYIEEVSWQHSNKLGLTMDDYERLDRALVVIRHEIDYTAPAFEGEELEMATWIVEYDQRFRVARQFQLVRISDQKTLMRCYTRFACVTLTSGKLRRLPLEFNTAYLPAVVTK